MSARAWRPLRRHMAMTFQDPVGSLSPRFTVRSILTEPYRIQGMKNRDLDAEARRLLKLVGLAEEFGDRYPYQLSGGQACRVGVARALALQPKLILADEPTAGLDVSVQGELLNLLNDLRKRLGLAMGIVTHNLNVVRHITDRMGIMYLGRFVEEGATAAIFAKPRHPYTLCLLSANPVPDPDARLERVALLGEPPSPATGSGGERWRAVRLDAVAHHNPVPGRDIGVIRRKSSTPDYSIRTRYPIPTPASSESLCSASRRALQGVPRAASFDPDARSRKRSVAGPPRGRLPADMACDACNR